MASLIYPAITSLDGYVADADVDECHLFIAPIVVGGGTRSLPDQVRPQLELVDERRFHNGMVHLSYSARAQSAT